MATKKNWKNEVYRKVYEKARNFSSPFSSEPGYYSIKPTPIFCSKKNKEIMVEWLQPSYWGYDILINYRTDNLRLGDFTDEELKQLCKIV